MEKNWGDTPSATLNIPHILDRSIDRERDRANYNCKSQTLSRRLTKLSGFSVYLIPEMRGNG